MAVSDMTPGQLAQLDQMMATGLKTLDRLVQTVQLRTPAAGEQQALADTVALIYQAFGPGARDSLLTAALYRLAFPEKQQVSADTWNGTKGERTMNSPTDRHGGPLAVGSRVRPWADSTDSDNEGVITWIEPIYNVLPDGTRFTAVEVTRDNGAAYMTFSNQVAPAPSSLWRKFTHHFRALLALNRNERKTA